MIPLHPYARAHSEPGRISSAGACFGHRDPSLLARRLCTAHKGQRLRRPKLRTRTARPASGRRWQLQAAAVGARAAVNVGRTGVRARATHERELAPQSLARPEPRGWQESCDGSAVLQLLVRTSNEGDTKGGWQQSLRRGPKGWSAAKLLQGTEEEESQLQVAAVPRGAKYVHWDQF